MRILAIAGAKISSKLIKLSGAGMGSSLPGKIACTLDAPLLSYLTSQLEQGCMAVTGTNGKSTTSGLLASILTRAGYRVVHNRQGANLIAGIVASLVESTQLNGKLKAELGLFEVDEAALPVLTKQVVCKTVVVTNLFRDQLDRYGELDKTASLITQGIKTNNSIAILNADDPNVCNLSCPAVKLYYGIDNIIDDINASTQSTDSSHSINTPDEYIIKEVSYCPKCGEEIVYENRQLSFVVWHCPQCKHSRPALDVSASKIKLLPASSKFTLNHKQSTVAVDLPLPGLFNVYNSLAAATAAISRGIDLQTIKDGLQNYKTLFGRSEKIKINERSILIQLIKNPAGASQAIKSLLDSHCSQAIVAINDNLADGRDISWLWDAQFELLSNAPCQFIVSGQRAEDMAVRLKYAGIDSNKITCQPVLSAALKEALTKTPTGSTIWILPTYTCLLELLKILKGYKIEYL